MCEKTLHPSQRNTFYSQYVFYQQSHRKLTDTDNQKMLTSLQLMNAHRSFVCACVTGLCCVMIYDDCKNLISPTRGSTFFIHFTTSWGVTQANGGCAVKETRSCTQTWQSKRVGRWLILISCSVFTWKNSIYQKHEYIQTFLFRCSPFYTRCIFKSDITWYVFSKQATCQGSLSIQANKYL